MRPQIATNTGNIIRLCANVGAHLHLVNPLGFSLDESSVKRAGLDYHELTITTVHDSLDDALVAARPAGRVTSADGDAYACSGHATRVYSDVEFGLDDVFVFGTERHGLAVDDLARFDESHRLRIPMRPNNRSLNLANAVAVVTYEAWRQHGFAGADSTSIDGTEVGNTTAESLTIHRRPATPENAQIRPSRDS